MNDFDKILFPWIYCDLRFLYQRLLCFLVVFFCYFYIAAEMWIAKYPKTRNNYGCYDFSTILVSSKLFL